ncbi:glycosyltransferase family 39 protein [Candidatus Amesbacteria bacterium]|nr:glycosyltransferase family 39 protein [Candidatus Amesbacteria bacterium]
MKKQILIGGIILIISALLRFLNLNAWPIFADEAIYVRWAQVMKAESTLRFLPLSDGKQPLYMWVMIPFLKVFPDPLIAGRVLSGLSGVLGVVGVGLLAYLLSKNINQALVASGIYAVIPFSVLFSRMALVDSMLVMFIIWGLALFIIGIEYKRWDFSMLTGFAFGFAWLTKSPAIFSLILLPSIFFLYKWQWKNLGYLATVWAIAFGMYNILRLGPEFHMIALRNLDYVWPLTEIIKHPLDPLKPHMIDAWNFFWYLMTPVGMVLSLVGIKKNKIIALWWLVPIFIQALIAKGFTARYLLFTLPFAVILINKYNKILLTLIIVPALIIDGLIIFQPESVPLPRNERAGYLEEWTAGQGIKEVSKQIIQMSKEGSVLVGSEGFFGTPFSALEMYLNKVPNVRVIGVGVWIDSVSDKLTNSLVDNQVVLVVNSDRLHIDDYGKHNLTLLASYPKAIKPNGIQNRLLFFKVNAK